MAKVSTPSSILVVIRKDGRQLGHYRLGPGEYLVGRDLSCAIRIDDATISRLHIRLTHSDGKCFVEDLQSTHGTFFGDERLVEAKHLTLPAELRLGKLQMEIKPATEASCATEVLERFKGRKYAISDRIGQGGMGLVMAANDQHANRTVAMKRLLPGLRNSSDSLQRFVREAEILGRLEHPNIVPLHEVGLDDRGQIFYTMKLVKGETLHAILKKIKAGDAETIAQYPLSQLLVVFQKVCDAIGYAHSHGIIHRDLKPANLMVGKFGEVMVMDWGLAKGIRQPEENEATTVQTAEAEEGFSENLTMPGAVMGTPSFMAPEQAHGKAEEMDERTDIFALGGLLYNILTLRVPVGGTSVVEMMERIKNGNIPPPVYYNHPGALEPDGSKADQPIVLAHCADQKVPESLSAVAIKALALHKAARYQTVADLQKDVAAYQNGFATQAEEAGLLKHLKLFVRRHKAVSAAAAFFMALTGLFFITLFASERRASARMVQLQRTAPTFYDLAVSLVDQKRFEEALEKIDIAVTLQPEQAKHHHLRGNILQTLARFGASSDSYRQCLKLDGSHRLAAENLKLSETLAGRKNGTNLLAYADMQKLRQAMLSQGRLSEAVALGTMMGQVDQNLYETCAAKLKEMGVTGKIEHLVDGRLSLDLSDSSVTNLAPLKDLPIGVLHLDHTRVKDLSPLKGMALEELDLTDTAVSDLKPLAGMSLKNLNLSDMAVSDLAPLEGMPINALSLKRILAKDFSVLRRLPLEFLYLHECKITDLTPLQGTSLKRLSIYHCPIKDINPLANTKLTELTITWCWINSIDSLKGLSLERLGLVIVGVTNIEVLRGMRLRSLTLEKVPISDLSPLQGSALLDFVLKETRVRDISHLRGMPLRWLWIDDDISDLSPLNNMAFDTLVLSDCRNLRDYTPLTTCSNLKYLKLPYGAQNIESLRGLTNLQRLTFQVFGTYNFKTIDWNQATTPQEFWQAFDSVKPRK